MINPWQTRDGNDCSLAKDDDDRRGETSFIIAS